MAYYYVAIMAYYYVVVMASLPWLCLSAWKRDSESSTFFTHISRSFTNASHFSVKV